MKRPRLGEQELTIYRYVADRKSASVREVADAFAREQGLARTTVLTVLERLRKKGYLARSKDEGAFQYRATSGEGEVMNSVVANFVQNMLGGSLAPFVAYLNDSKDLKREELDELRRVVEHLEDREKDDA